MKHFARAGALIAVGAVAVMVVAFGIWHGTAFANGESFTPITLSPSLSYDASSQSVNISGTVTAGTETFTTQAVCFGQTPQVYSVTGPLEPNGATLNITNSAGQTVFSNTSWLASTNDTHTFGYVCPQGSSLQRPLTGNYLFNIVVPTIDVSSWPAGTYTASMVITPGCAPSYGYTSCSPAPPNATWSEQFSVTHPAGIVTVTSENANDHSVGVNAEWDLTAQATSSAVNSVGGFICSDTGSLGGSVIFPWSDGTSCSGAQQTYHNVPEDNDPVGIPQTETTTVPDYSFNSVEQIPIAKNTNLNGLEVLQFSLRNIFSSVALADTVDAVNSNGTIATGTRSWTLTSSSPSAAFIILWDPHVTDMQVSPTSASFTSSGSMSQVETITASGAPAANLDWTASVSTTSGGNWLSVSPSNGTIQVNNSGSGTESATISASAGSLSDGSYSGTVTFKGYDENGAAGTPVASRTVSVTLTVSTLPPPPPGGGSGYSCINNACSAVSSGAQYSSLSSCNAACGEGPGNGPTPSSTPPGGGGGGSGGNGGSGGSGGGGNGGGGSLPACTPGVNCPVCSPALTATPASIVVPESSNLSYSCSHVTECQLVKNSTGQVLQDIGAGASQTIDTTQNPYAVTPSITTSYTLACVNSNYENNANNPASASATVTVSASSYCEQNPNGAGCQ